MSAENIDIAKIIKKQRDLFLNRLNMEYPNFADHYYEDDANYNSENCVYRNASTWDINNGYCEEFADLIVSLVPGAQSPWMEEIDEYLPDDMLDENGLIDCPTHCVIVYNGKIYDAECPDGVTTVQDLPIRRNAGKNRNQVLSERLAAGVVP